MLKSKKSKKIGALCCAIALAVTCAVPAFAATDNWANVYLPMYRQTKTLAQANHDSYVLSAHVYLTRNDVGTMWLQVYWPSESSYETQEYVATGDINFSMTYLDSLDGGADNFLYQGYTSGSCNFN